MALAGKMTSHGLVCPLAPVSRLAPSLSMLPQLGVGGCTDRPRKASVPSRTMMVATAIRPNETMVGMMLGRSSRVKIRRSLAPRALAASTKSRVAYESVDARTTRKMSGAPKTPMMSVIFQRLWPQNETMAITATRAGNASTTYDVVFKAVSIRPRR